MESCFFFLELLCNRLSSRRWLCSSQHCCLKWLDHIILFGVLLIPWHGTQLHLAGGLSVNILLSQLMCFCYMQ